MRVGLAVSGGADSTALLVLMAELRAEHGFDAVVLHVDHGLRRESAADAAFVKRLAARFDVPFHLFRTKVRPAKGESIEMAARRARLGFFAEAMKRLRLDCIATGHQMDDVAETFLMRLKRASGADGLAGLKPVSRVGKIVFIRPLLDVRAADLRAFLKSRGIAWREDATNADTSILRNKVRHVILPFLARELDPKIVEHICRSASYLRSGKLQLTQVERLKSRKVEKLYPHEDNLSTVQRFNRREPPRYVLEVSAAVGYEREPIEIGRLPASGWLSAAALRGRTLAVRTWQPGDWMEPCGFPHRRKLQDIFVTAKVASPLRHSLPLVADDATGEVLWLPGYRVSDPAKVRAEDEPSVRFRLSAAADDFKTETQEGDDK